MNKLVVIAALSATFLSHSLIAEDKTIQVMVLGTYHMGNPGLDLVNMESEDVRTPHRQKELADLTNQLARFKPTKVAVEAVPVNADFTSGQYLAFTEEQLLENPNERVQIGYRLARQMGHDHVYEIDEQSDEIDFFPFGAVQEYAQQHDQMAVIESMMGEVQAKMAKFESSQSEKTIAQLLAEMNDPAESDTGHARYYYGLIDLSGPESQPGADLNAYWYMRNVRIFSKLAQVAEPGDRIVLLYGAGHNYWFRHFAQTMPGYELVEPNPYLLAE